MSDNTEVYVIFVAANLAGMYTQTLRNYDRFELVTPQRASGGGRRYTKCDVAPLCEIRRPDQEDNVNSTGTKATIDLTERVDSLEQENVELRERLYQVKAQTRYSRGELVYIPHPTVMVMRESRTRCRHRVDRGEGG